MNDSEDFFEEELREPTKRDRLIKGEEYREAWEGVFDVKTVEAIETLKRRKVIEDLYWVVSTGKEADVFYARSPSGADLAVKIYRIHTSKFRRVDIYTLGDKRFGRYKSVIKAKWGWARREFKNLKRAWDAGVHVPRPIAIYRNVVVMEFIGENGTPAPQLKDVTEIDNAEEVFQRLVDDIEKLYKKAKIVHADLSPYNILYHRGIAYIIDMAQGVPISHEFALRFLYRDLYHIVNYFSAFLDMIPSPDELYKRITGKEPDYIVRQFVE